MKVFSYKWKSAMALALAMSLFCPQVYAAESLSAEEQGVKQLVIVQEEPEPLPQLTMEEALKMAKKNSAALREIQDQEDLLTETRRSLRDMGFSMSTPIYDYQRWVNDMWHAVSSSIFQVKMGLEGAKIQREVEHLKLEISVKSYFTSIVNNQDTLELLKKNAEIQQRLYVQGQTKHRLGMLSKYNLEQLKIAADQAKNNVALLQASLDQEYTKFNQLIGGNHADRYELVYDMTFEPYTMHQTMDQYVNDKIKNKDLAIKGQELAVENAKFSLNYRAESDWSSDDQLEFNYDSAKRSLKTAKQNKETLLRNTYLQIQQLETQYASAQADVTKAAANYRVAQVNYRAGNVTKTVVEQAEMGLISAENALKELVYSHDMLIFMFENPTVLVDTSAMQ